MIVTFRAEFTPAWVGRSHVTLLSLSRLGRQQSAEMIARLTDGKPLPQEIVDQIIDRPDGVPLFIEKRINLSRKYKLRPFHRCLWNSAESRI
jgi:predicted ATPase